MTRKCRRRRVLSLFHVFQVYERGTISVKMVYKRVRGKSSGRNLLVKKKILSTPPPHPPGNPFRWAGACFVRSPEKAFRFFSIVFACFQNKNEEFAQFHVLYTRKRPKTNAPPTRTRPRLQNPLSRNIRALQAKIKLPKRSHSMVTACSKLTKTY